MAWINNWQTRNKSPNLPSFLFLSFYSSFIFLPIVYVSICVSMYVAIYLPIYPSIHLNLCVCIHTNKRTSSVINKCGWVVSYRWFSNSWWREKSQNSKGLSSIRRGSDNRALTVPREVTARRRPCVSRKTDPMRTWPCWLSESRAPGSRNMSRWISVV